MEWGGGACCLDIDFGFAAIGSSVCGESSGRSDHLEVNMSVQVGTTLVGENHSSELRVSGNTRTGFVDSGLKGTKKLSILVYGAVWVRFQKQIDSLLCDVFLA